MPRMPYTVDRREVVFGDGFAAAAYCATRRAIGKAPPIVFGLNLASGGVFAQLQPFKLNSQNNASVASIESPGPSRVVPTADVDDLNWIPNSEYQVRQSGAYEYPSSADMATAIARTLRAYADLYTGMAEVGLTFDRVGRVRMADGTPLGIAKRIIWAAGVQPKTDFIPGPAVMSGYEFMKKPPGELHRRRIAIIGGGDTAAQCAEYMLGQGMYAPSTPPDEIHWYGDQEMPLSKDSWMRQYHARFAGLGRHFPENDKTERSVVRPFNVRGYMVNLGKTAMVNGLVYDLVVMATGFNPTPCPVIAGDTYRVGDMAVARSNESETIGGTATVFKIGIASGLSASFAPYQSRFPAAKFAMYNQGPRIAALAAALP